MEQVTLICSSMSPGRPWAVEILQDQDLAELSQKDGFDPTWSLPYKICYRACKPYFWDPNGSDMFSPQVNKKTCFNPKSGTLSSSHCRKKLKCAEFGYFAKLLILPNFITFQDLRVFAGFCGCFAGFCGCFAGNFGCAKISK